MSQQNTEQPPAGAESVIDKIRSLTAKFDRVASGRNVLRSELEEAKDREIRLRRENAILTDKVSDLEFKLKEKAEDVDRLEGEIREASSHLKRTEWSRQELTRYEEHMKDEVAKLRNQLVDLAERRDVLENELAVSQKLVDTLRGERDSLSTKLQQAQSELDGLKRTFDATRSDLEQSRREYQDAQKEFGAFPPNVREKMQKDLESAQEKLAALEAEAKDYSARLSEKEDALLERDMEIQALRRQVSRALA
jgi:chromosome segregation protein